MELRTIKAPAGSGGGGGAFSDPRKNIAVMGLAEGLIVADFGAGSGHYSIAAAKAVGHSGKVYAIDIQQALLLRLKAAAGAEQVRNIEILRGDIEQVGGTKLREKMVDVVLLANILFQVDHKGNLLAEAKRVLKEKGRLFAIDWTDSFGGLGPPPSDVVTGQEASELFTQAGFTVEKRFDAGAHHWGLLARRTKDEVRITN